MGTYRTPVPTFDEMAHCLRMGRAERISMLSTELQDHGDYDRATDLDRHLDRLIHFNGWSAP